MDDPKWLEEWYEEYPFDRVDAASRFERGIMRLLAHIREWRKLGADVADRCECKTVGDPRYHRDICLPCRARTLLDRETPPEVK